MESPFEKLEGVVDVQSGYTGGTKPNPTYDEVSSGATGHAEAVQVRYDPARITYERLLDVFWRQIDPTDAGGQFADRGTQYRTAIFYHDETQRQQAEASRRVLEQTKRFQQPIVTEIVLATQFYPAEEHHQKYHQKNRTLYEYYRWRCGRDRRLAEVWGTAPSGREEQR
jgi:methionine-S-sulfoxide reductase